MSALTKYCFNSVGIQAIRLCLHPYSLLKDKKAETAETAETVKRTTGIRSANRRSYQ
jgi:hypothetical protein